MYLFHHLPKCGGTSLTLALEDWFTVVRDYYLEQAPDHNKEFDIRFCDSRFCIVGHFGHDGFFIDQRYPMVFDSLFAHLRYRVFTFVRDPLSMRCSLYRHDVAKQRSVESHLVEGIMHTPNYFSRILGVDESNYRRLLDKYFFIGIFEQLQDDFDLLAKALSKSRIELTDENKSKRIENASIENLTAPQIAKFKALNSLDYEIYNYAKTLNARFRRKYA